MAALTIKVEVLDADGRTVATDHAYGNSMRTVDAAAKALAMTLAHEHETYPLGPCTTKLGRAVKS